MGGSSGYLNGFLNSCPVKAESLCISRLRSFETEFAGNNLQIQVPCIALLLNAEESQDSRSPLLDHP